MLNIATTLVCLECVFFVPVLTGCGLNNVRPLANGSSATNDSVTGITNAQFVTIFTESTNTEPGYILTTKGILDRLKKNVNPVEFQSWAEKLIAEAAGGPGEFPKHKPIPPEDLKRYLDIAAEGKPLGSGVLATGRSNDSCVAIVWGGGMAMYGIQIGSKDYVCHYDYYIEWLPGIYVWHSSR